MTQIICLEMEAVQLIMILDAVGVSQALEHAPKEHTQTPIAVEDQSLE